MGIWIPHTLEDHFDFAGDSEDEIAPGDANDTESDNDSGSYEDEDESQGSDEDQEAPSLNVANSRFGALAIDAEDEEDTDDPTDSETRGNKAE